MHRSLSNAAVLLTALFTASVALAHEDEALQSRVPKVQIALLMDNSGSMQGLLNQARTQVWKVVNELSRARQRGVAPRVELALYEYGVSPRRLSAFTSDLDKVGELLFGLKIAGGAEYCGQVIQQATRELEWSGNPDDLKLIYIAGNEPFTQGPVPYARAISEAKRKGITVNTLHCGGHDATWQQGALLAGGNYLSINHNAAIAHVATPQDAEIARLGAALNQTYLGYGAKGQARKSRQSAMDGLAAAAAPSAEVERTLTKSSRLYNNAEWDLVDAMKKGDAKPSALAKEELPAELRALPAVERDAYVEKKAKERDAIQQKLAALKKDRDAFLAEQKAKSPAQNTLDEALIQSVREQGRRRAYTF